MAKVDRRSFVQILITGAAEAVALPVVVAQEAVTPPVLPPPDPQAVALESSSQRLEVATEGGRLSFRSFVRQDAKWKAATLPQVPLVTGPSFVLEPARIDRSGHALHGALSRSAGDLLYRVRRGYCLR